MTVIQQKIDELSSQVESAIAEGRYDVPLLPTVASRILDLCNDDDADAKQISDLIQSDQSLAAHVMKVANSPLYSPNGNLVSLQQAITRLGMTTISEIAVTSSLNAKTFAVPELQTELNYVWNHSLATALWSKEIARECRNNVECVFLCGLLHSIGRPAVLQLATDLAKASNTYDEIDDWSALVEKFHKPLGVTIAEHWKMPSVVVDVLKYVDQLTECQNNLSPTAVVHAASHFAHHLLDPASVHLEELFELKSLEPLNLYQDQVEKLVDKMAEVSVCMEALQS